MGIELQRLPVVMARTGFRKTSIYRMVKAGKFPAPIKLGERVIAWQSDEVDAWIHERIKAGRRS